MHDAHARGRNEQSQPDHRRARVVLSSDAAVPGPVLSYTEKAVEKVNFR
jgi:hypothetical protein